MKMNKKLLVLTSFIVLIPIFIGLALWNQLPDQVPTHFDFSGNPDDYSSKFQAVFFLPFFSINLTSFLFMDNYQRPKIWSIRKSAISGLLDCSNHFYFCAVNGYFIFNS